MECLAAFLLLAFIASIKANELVKMSGIADQSVFAHNLRGPLGGTIVNGDIVKSIKEKAHQKKTPLFHNGITIVTNHRNGFARYQPDPSQNQKSHFLPPH